LAIHARLHCITAGKSWCEPEPFLAFAEAGCATEKGEGLHRGDFSLVLSFGGSKRKNIYIIRK